ncbi:uncharacterized protein LOC131952805 [Physella acuta]|uniref:uncharacterized protein LOC131952805 n=1 Tax=Physella acuta TaxID=109671 RepID=UPI0027DC56A8|nr:uncharacterized protein LOC131952805 [Physella acuta]
MAVSRFSYRRKVPVALDMPEKDKENCGFYRAIAWTSPVHHIPVYPDWHQFRHVAFYKDDGTESCEIEDVWSDYFRQQHHVKAAISHPIGTQPSDVPEFKRNGHQRNLQKDPPMSMFLHPYNAPWPKRDANIPPARFPRGEYYSYYHDAFKSSNLVRHRLLPLPQRVEPHEIPDITPMVKSRNIYIDKSTC